MTFSSDHYTIALSDACSGFEALKPPNRVRVSEGAVQNLVIKQPGSAGGAWSAEETPYMVAPMDSLGSREHEATVFVGPARTGKCLDVDTPIPTPNGWTRMGDLEAGDIVFGSDGAPTEVEVAHAVLHGLSCYRVTLSDGSTLVADADHLWGVERFYWKAPNWRYEVRTTAELLADLTYSQRADGRRRFRYRIRNASPVQCRPAHLDIDPYLLGAWLGNGMTGKAQISQHTDDTEHYLSAVKRGGFSARASKDGPNTTIAHIGFDGDTEPMRFISRLRALNLVGNKHIPAEYLRASEEQRWSLLRGMMDTDGYPGDGSQTGVEFSTVSHRLAQQFCELARSLGLKPITKHKNTTWTHLGERKFGETYRVTFPVPPTARVFTLPRKVEKCVTASIDVDFRQIVSIEPVESRPVRCIKVAATDSLFLAGDGFVPTHNTAGLLLGWLSHTVVNDPGDFLMMQMSKEKAREFSKTDVDRALRNSPSIHAMKSTRAIDSNTFDTMFRHGMFLRIAWPTITNVSGSTYRYVAITDIDRIENAENVDGEGNLFDLAKKRTTTFLSRGMTLVESSPGKPLEDPNWKPATAHEAPPTRGILSLYNRSDRHRWYWRCPDCSESFEAAPGLGLFSLLPPEEALLEDIRTMSIATVANEFAKVVCPHCGSILDPKWKSHLNRPENGALWIPDGMRIDRDGVLSGDPLVSKMRGYWLGGVAAAYQSWASLVGNHLTGLQDYALTGSEEKLKQTINTDQGAPFMSMHLRQVQAQSNKPEDRAEALPRYVVPPETRCLGASVDVQGGITSRFVVQVMAIGPNREKWLVDRFEIKESFRPGMGSEFAPIDPARYAEDWDVLTEKLLRSTWRTPDAGREIKLKFLVVDTGGEDGVTDKAYAWKRRLRAAGLWHKAILYKGASHKGAPITKESLVGKRTAKEKGDIPLLVCNPNLLSDMVSADLKRKTPGIGYIHLPKAKHPTTNPDGWLPQAFYDELDAEVRDPDGTWRQVRPRNESFDLLRMLYAGMLYLGLDKIKDWNSVPAWLAPLDQNSEVITVEDRRAMKDNVRLGSVDPEKPAVRVVGQRPSRARRHAYAGI